MSPRFQYPAPRMSSVCDGWQPLEERYQLSRQCLELLVRHAFPVGILTKSGLVRRDIEVMRGGEVDVGVTLTTVDEDVRRILEPGASPVGDRLDVLRRAKAAGLTTYVFAGPLFPFLCDGSREVDALFRAIAAAGVDYLFVDKLNPKAQLWPSLKAALSAHAPHTVRKVGEILYDADAREHYVSNLRRLVGAAADRFGLSSRVRSCL